MCIKPSVRIKTCPSCLSNAVTLYSCTPPAKKMLSHIPPVCRPTPQRNSSSKLFHHTNSSGTESVHDFCTGTAAPRVISQSRITTLVQRKLYERWRATKYYRLCSNYHFHLCIPGVVLRDSAGRPKITPTRSSSLLRPNYVQAKFSFYWHNNKI